MSEFATNTAAETPDAAETLAANAATHPALHAGSTPGKRISPGSVLTSTASSLSLDIEYLTRHNIPHTLEAVTKQLLYLKPTRPHSAMIHALRDIRIRDKTKQFEHYIGQATEGMDAQAKGEVDRQVGAIVSLERDESIKSESSTFSVNSTDMAEFIADIRDAYQQLKRSRVCNNRVSKVDLGDIIDLIAYPIPERILCDMFSEVDTDHLGEVNYLDCIAKMTFRIQGTFHADALRPIYMSCIHEHETLLLEERMTIGVNTLASGLSVGSRDFEVESGASEERQYNNTGVLPISELPTALKRLDITANQEDIDGALEVSLEGGGGGGGGGGGALSSTNGFLADGAAADVADPQPAEDLYLQFPRFVTVVNLLAT